MISNYNNFMEDLLLEPVTYYKNQKGKNIRKLLGDFFGKLLSVNQEDLDIIHIACTLYWKILCGHLDFLASIDMHKIDKELLYDDLCNLCDFATGFEDKSARLDIENKAVNRKAKWAYDICKSIDSLNTDDIIKNIGTLPKLKIVKNG